MEYPEIDHLYKFYNFNTNAFSTLINNTIWFSKPATLNDPFDIDIDLNHSMTSSDFNNMIQSIEAQPSRSQERMDQLRQMKQFPPDQQALDKMTQVIKSKFREDRKDWGVFCLCESYKNILMWSHYADRHKGFCVQFDRNENNRLGDIEYTRPVSYSCKYPSPNIYSSEGEKKVYDELFFTKAKCWKYEREWRILNDKGDIELPLIDFTTISGIVFGLNMPPPQRETIRRILSDQKEIVFGEMIKVPDKFEMEIVWL